MIVKNYKDLKPLTYTILLKDTIIVTKIKGKLESKQKLKRVIMYYVVEKKIYMVTN